jgi:hypothetical protein
MTSTDPLITPELKMRAATALAAYQHSRPIGARPPTFTPTPFELHPIATLKEASEEMLRIAGVVAAGALDHDTGQFLIATIKAFAETLTVVKTEREITLTDALKSGGGA